MEGQSQGIGEDKKPAAVPAAVSGGTPNALALAAAARLLQQAQHHHQAVTAVAGKQPAAPTALNAGALNADTLQALASFMGTSAAAISSANNHLIPSSAPVSSLLPPVHTTTSQQQQQHGVVALQSQIVALLATGGAPVSATPSPAASGPRAPFATSHHAASHLLRHHTTPHVAAVAVPSSMALPNMQNWSLEQLRQHVQLLEQLEQPVPQTIALLLADAKRKEEKRNAKRIANRKSASTSRARKKAYVQEMTELNARLKRQALILSLLPDMVLVINTEGKITFCSAQAEKILRYDMQELVGVKLSTLLVPASKDKLNRLVTQLLGPVAKAVIGKSGSGSGSDKGDSELVAVDQGEGNVIPGEAVSGTERSAGGAKGTAISARISEPTFPLSVVQVEAKKEKTGKKMSGGALDDHDNSDTSNTSASKPSKQPSSLTQSNTSGRSAAVYPKEGECIAEENSGGDGGGEVGRMNQFPSSDVSNTSSLSTNAKNVQQANTNLERNVRIHNKKMKTESGSKFRDDVTGADVTANNATARLSSLQHQPESSSSEEDSGYRESNDSREETSSSVSDSSGSNGRRKPIAPTCNICLIRKDMTTLWCEVTSSVRTKLPEDAASTEAEETMSVTDSSKRVKLSADSRTPPPPDRLSIDQSAEPKEEDETELLLCLRPVRDGDQKIRGRLRYEGSKKTGKKKRSIPDNNAWTGEAPSPPSVPACAVAGPNRPFKKRGLAEVSKHTTSTSKGESQEASDDRICGVDTDAAESLMLMTKKK